MVFQGGGASYLQVKRTSRAGHRTGRDVICWSKSRQAITHWGHEYVKKAGHSFIETLRSITRNRELKNITILSRFLFSVACWHVYQIGFCWKALIDIFISSLHRKRYSFMTRQWKIRDKSRNQQWWLSWHLLCTVLCSGQIKISSRYLWSVDK